LAYNILGNISTILLYTDFFTVKVCETFAMWVRGVAKRSVDGRA